MTEYLDVIAWKKTSGGKNFAVKLGSAKKLDNGNIAVYLDALPIPGADGCQLTIAPRRDNRGAQVPAARDPGMDQDIPF